MDVVIEARGRPSLSYTGSFGFETFRCAIPSKSRFSKTSTTRLPKRWVRLFGAPHFPRTSRNDAITPVRYSTQRLK